MSTKFTKEFEVHYYEINSYYEATPMAILNYLEESAIAHSKSVGLGIDELKLKGLGWVLNRWNLKMDKYPAWGENIVIETWPWKFERFYANRAFVIKDSKGNIIGRAASLWIFLNTQNKRPTRVPEEFGEIYGVCDEKPIEEPFSKLEICDEPENSEEFFVRISDIDTNNHVNNIKYAQWLLDAIPKDIYNEHILSSLEVEYKKEALLGHKIRVDYKNIKENIFNCKIFATGEDKELAIAKLDWKKI